MAKPVSTRTRFEIFKRDGFTCRYCGRKSPAVVLEVDHIIPLSKGGEGDPTNLVTSCFDCNRGKADKNLSEIITGEDPHDRAVELLERERQLAEYNEVRNQVEARIQREIEWVLDCGGKFGNDGRAEAAFRQALREFSIHDVRDAFNIAIQRTGGSEPLCTKYFSGIIKRWHQYGSREAAERAWAEESGRRGE